MSENRFHVGDEVIFINPNMHEHEPGCYPRYGTVGRVVGVLLGRYCESDLDTKIKWPKGTTSSDDIWYVNHNWIELAHPDQGEVEKSDLPISFLLDAEVDV